MRDGPTTTEHDGFQSGLQLDLTPLGARLFFDVPMSDLTGRAVALDDLLPRRVRPLAGRLAELPDWDARFDRLDALLGERIAASRVDARVARGRAGGSRTRAARWTCARSSASSATATST